ncbi:hypothetical protein DFQ28_001023 [Apophysomyces sp. BC1034]|nr:hypothetical protein DFQ30_000869 [Apophysomyces sp. BC1015]KAG0180899.1 hypothetical protein DFQ29_009908 [Apophysomyces sp. BC1021]KAG0191071.1 hypothetical protein DFQ28_001023 [Apophysomyces sp. BC1034]
MELKPEQGGNTASAFTLDNPEEKSSAEALREIPKDILPDFRNLGNRAGLQTELGTSDATEIIQALTNAQRKPVPQPVQIHKPLKRSSTARSQLHTPKSPRTPKSPPTAAVPPSSAGIPDWFRTGWTAFSTKTNPGGSLPFRATEKAENPLEAIVSELIYSEWWTNAGVVLVVGVIFWQLSRMGGGLVTFLVACLFLATYYQITSYRFDRNARDDIERELAKLRIETDTEPVEWLNSVVQNFWLIFEPVLSAYVIENIDTYLVDYLPGFLDSVRLTTFTLGTKPFKVESVKTLPNTEEDTVCMDWTVSFVPNDTSEMTKKQIERKINPKVVLNIRLGKGMVGAGIPVLVENMSFRGQMRIKFKFMSKFPHVKTVEACFMDKPQFDYVLKPIGGETFGFDVNNIPGLQGFVRDQVHTILGPMMYYPNTFAFDVDKFFAGELDITQANGVLAVTVYSASTIGAGDGSLNPYIRFFLDKAQELGRTSVRENTLEPIWNETHFLLLNNLNSILTLELRNHSTNTKDRRVARSHFDLVDLTEEDDYELRGLDLVMQRHGKPITDLKADMRYLPVSKPIARDDGTVEPAAESNSGVLRFTVHECHSLGSTKLCPYARVFINSAEKIKTPVFKYNANPKFERPGEVVVLDKTEVSVRVEIKDSVSFAEDRTIGVWTSYLVDIMELQEKNEYWWDLEANEKFGGRIRFSVQWKPVVMTGLTQGMGGHGYYSPPVGVVRFAFWEARDLRNVEAVTKSDPYVRVMSGLQIRARTEVVDNNLNPEWGEFHYVPVHSIREDLVLEVMDWNAKTKDRSLGSTVLRMKELIRQRVGDQEEDPDKWFAPTGVKIDKWAPLKSVDRRTPAKGELRYTAEFFPTLTLPQMRDEDEDLPLDDLHGVSIKYTPDDLVDLSAYNSGVLMVRIHEVKLDKSSNVYCQLLVDSLAPQFKTTKAKGKTLAFNEAGDAFIKEADFSRVAIEIKPANADDKDDTKLGHWVDATNSIIRRIQNLRRENKEEEDDGEWFELLGTDGPGWIRLSFDYTPLTNFTLNPDESLENQGNLTVTLISAKNLKAADKSGTSDPYVVFTVNGERLHTSEVVKKTVSPQWKNEQFVAPILSRVTASFRVEVLDWNQIQGHEPLGSGGISIRGGSVESFVARDVLIPLDGVSGVSGSVRVRLLWQPQLLVRKKTHTSMLATTTRIFTKTINTKQTATFDYSKKPQTGRSTTSLLSNNSPRTEMMHPSRVPSAVAGVTEETEKVGGEGMDGTIMVRLIEARGLHGVDKGGTSDPFVRVRIGRQQVYKTKHIKKSLSPVWHEYFQYNVSSQPTILDIKIKDHNTFSHDVDLCDGQWNLWDLIHPPQESRIDRWLQLAPAGSGEIHIAIDFVAATRGVRG